MIDGEQRKRLLAMVTAMDDAAGMLVSALKDAGMWENTLFVFFSDNGGSVQNNNGQVR